MTVVKRPPLSEGEKALFGKIAHLICREGCSYTEAAHRLGMMPGSVRGLVRRWEVQTGGNFTELLTAARADRIEEWVRGGKKGPAPKLTRRVGLTDIGLLVACLERGVLLFDKGTRPYPPETAEAARQYAETCLRPEERERMIGLINYRSTVNVELAAADKREAVRVQQKEEDGRRGPRGIRRVKHETARTR